MFPEMYATQVHSFNKESSTSEDMAEAQHASHASQGFRAGSFVEFRYSFPSYVEIVPPFMDQLMRFISKFREDDETNSDIELAVREALVNAIVHGNQQDPRKCVYVRSRCTTDGEVSITIDDEGQGFNSDAVPDPTSPTNRLRTHGRGIYLMKTLMDEVDFQQGGSVVHMRKRANGDSETTRKRQ
jgi:serine/threonine-protein kinase RsbW